MSGYLAASPETSRVSMPGSFSRMKSARTGSRAKGFISGTDPSPSYRHVSLMLDFKDTDTNHRTCITQ